jgi:hypothetical protein
MVLVNELASDEDSDNGGGIDANQEDSDDSNCDV